MRPVSTATGSAKQTSHFWLFLGLLGAVLLFLFSKSLDPHQVLFNNDAPLGFLSAECNHLPSRFAGTWRELSWLGVDAPAAAPDLSILLRTLVSPVAYLKTCVPLALLFLGVSAWLFFRQLKFSPIVCVLGGVAAGLNAHFFSIACWGLAHWSIAAACSFLAMAALYAKSIPKVWEKAVLAGLATGMGVMEGYDVGAILSVFVGIFIVFRCLNDEGGVGRRVANAIMVESLVVLFAGIIAAHTMMNLVQTQVEGISAMEQDAQTKQTRWNAATQWSLPKLETLQVMVPGLFGYRLSGNIDETNHASSYWGLIGQDPGLAALGSDDPLVRSNAATALKLPDSYLPALDKPDRYSRTAGMQAAQKKSGRYWRYSGSGECAGTMVSLLALFGMACFFRKDGVFSKNERVDLGYWGVIAIFSLLASWGRFGFIYQLLYKLPYMSTIRNPVKFMNPFHIAWIILATYGMEVLYRRYLRGPTGPDGSLPNQLQVWWSKVKGFDRTWGLAMMVLAGTTTAAAVLLYLDKGSLVRYLEEQSFPVPLIPQIADFCIEHAFIFLAFLLAGMVTLAGILSGAWNGSRSKWAWGFVAALIIVDLARADAPWIHYYDYHEKYALNPVTEFLLDKPWEHRVIGKLEPRGPGSGITQGFGQLYFFWLQNDFPIHNIQSLDFSQMPRMPDLDRDYLKAFELAGADMRTVDFRPAVRLWELTNTRYILASANAMDFLNRRADPLHNSFGVQGHFNMRAKPGVAIPGDMGDFTVESGPKGEYGIIEYTRTLPRAKLYSNWKTPTNDAATLQILTDPGFEPWDTVLLATNSPVPQAVSTNTADPGTVAITDYHSKYIRLEADANAPAILLFNDRIDPDWKARVDSTDVPVLRCNDIMRGVSLTPGHHIVEFRFSPSLKTLYLSVSAIVVGLILSGYLIVTRKSKTAPLAPVAPSAPPPAPAPVVSDSQAKGPKSNGKTKRR